MNGGDGFLEGGVLRFGGPFKRSLVTAPLDLSLGGTISVTLRVGGDISDEETSWDRPEVGEGIQFRIDDGSGSSFGANMDSVRRLRVIDPYSFSSPFSPSNPFDPTFAEWRTYLISIPPSERQTNARLEISQINFSGPELDTWGIDSLCVFTQRPTNNAPIIDNDAPVTLTANPTGDPILVNFSRFVTEEDPLDRAFYQIGEVSNPAIFSGFIIDMDSGLLRFDFAAQSTGSSTVELIVTDRSGTESRHLLNVNAPVLTAPTIVREGLVELNPVTGKYEQTLTIANNGPREIAGIQVVVTSLNNGFVLDGWENNIAVSQLPLGPGETVSLVLEYHSSISGVAPRPDFEVQILSPAGQVTTPDGSSAALRTLVDSAKVFSFDSIVGEKYRVEYSYDMVNWQISPVTVTAGANRAQWLDQGPPKTDCHPSECTTRFYRAIQITE